MRAGRARVTTAARRGAAAAGPLLAWLLLLVGCAEMAPPPGGPVDTTSPRVLSTWPDSLATGVNPETPLELRFSEKVDHATVRDWLFIRPFRRIEAVRWKGATASVEVRDGWPRDSTVSVTLGTGVVDAHGRALEKPFRRTFSTGDSLDPGLLAGRLFRSRMAGREGPAGGAGGAGGAALPGAPGGGSGALSGGAGAGGAAWRGTAPAGAPGGPRGGAGYAVFVWIYRIRGDSLPDLARDDPDYLTQVDPDGSFLLEGLPVDVPLLLFAVQDNDRSRTFSRGARDYATLHPDTLRLAAAAPERRDLAIFLIDPAAPGTAKGRLMAPADTAAVDTLSWGVIVSELPPDTTGIGWPPARVARQAKVEKGGAFTVSGIPPGKYRVAAFLDSNRDGQWARVEPLGAAVVVEVLADEETSGLLLARPAP